MMMSPLRKLLFGEMGEGQVWVVAKRFRRKTKLAVLMAVMLLIGVCLVLWLNRTETAVRHFCCEQFKTRPKDRAAPAIPGLDKLVYDLIK